MQAPEPLYCTLFLVVAFVGAGIVQTAWLRCRMSMRFNKPLDGGKTFRGRRIFGDSKTWRGFVVMVPAVGCAFLIMGLMRDSFPLSIQKGLWSLKPWKYGLLGCWVGFGFMIGELPNSFLKRQLGIGPGESPTQVWAKPVCFFLDQVDSIVVALLALAVVVPIPLLAWVLLIVFGAVVHWLFNIVLFLIGVKTRPA